MHYHNVCLDSFGYTLPEQVMTSSDVETQLAPLYQRLRLPEGRLELITGIRERRVWAEGVLPSEKSVESAEKAIRASGIDRHEIGALIHASVCRDHLEPATACAVHHQLSLPKNCVVYDVSNACLGLLNGMVQIANMIELGQIRAGLVVGTESSRGLMETTIHSLNADHSLTRSQIKLAVASLTIGSGSCAMLLTDRELSNTGNRLYAVAAQANTKHHRLCHSGRDEAADAGMHPLMQTDSERLMKEGISTGVATFARFLAEAGLTVDSLEKTFCHQVGATHRKMMLEAMGIDLAKDFATVDWLGNTGSVALPTAMAMGLEQGHVRPGEQVGMLGIGSGINCLMAAVDWHRALVCHDLATVYDSQQSPLTTTVATSE